MQARATYPAGADKRLVDGELGEAFGTQHSFEPVCDAVERLPDGRQVSRFVARKRELDTGAEAGADRLA